MKTEVNIMHDPKLIFKDVLEKLAKPYSLRHNTSLSVTGKLAIYYTHFSDICKKCYFSQTLYIFFYRAVIPDEC